MTGDPQPDTERSAVSPSGAKSYPTWLVVLVCLLLFVLVVGLPAAFAFAIP